MKSLWIAGSAAVALAFSSTAALAAPPSGAAAPVVSSPAKSLSLRASASRKGESKLGGGNALGIGMLVIVAAGAVWAGIEMADNDDNNPVSP